MLIIIIIILKNRDYSITTLLYEALLYSLFLSVTVHCCSDATSSAAVFTLYDPLISDRRTWKLLGVKFLFVLFDNTERGASCGHFSGADYANDQISWMFTSSGTGTGTGGFIRLKRTIYDKFAQSRFMTHRLMRPCGVYWLLLHIPLLLVIVFFFLISKKVCMCYCFLFYVGVFFMCNKLKTKKERKFLDNNTKLSLHEVLWIIYWTELTLSQT